MIRSFPARRPREERGPKPYVWGAKVHELVYRVVTVAGETIDPEGFPNDREALAFGHESGVGGLWWVEARIGIEPLFAPGAEVRLERAILGLKREGQG